MKFTKLSLVAALAVSAAFAGGDIAPVEPVVETPAAVPAASGWDFAGKGVVYYQTNDTIVNSGAGPVGDLFAQEASAATAGVQLSATNKDLFAGVGAGVELSGVATLGLENDGRLVSNVMQGANGLRGGWISQAFLTYGLGNTSIKVGRQTLPKSLSPFAYSENWNVFHNTFDSVLLVNSDITDTTLVGAWVRNGNVNGMHANMADFGRFNEQDGVYMLTAQNKSISDLTLTGTGYYGKEMIGTDDLTILWGDAAYDAGSFGVALQGGTLMSDGFADDGVLYGAKLTGSIMGLNAMLAYSHSKDTYPHQLGGSTSAMYTSTVVNQVLGGALTETDADKYVLGANMDALGGNIAGAYAYTDSDKSDKTNEFDLVYSTNLTSNTNLVLAYVYADTDSVDDSINFVRVVGSYKF
jgi:hypothetical protein